VLLFQRGPAALIAGEEEIPDTGEPELSRSRRSPHAIVNRSDREIFLVVFYEEKELQTAPAKLL
jgi:hypothetical protein